MPESSTLIARLRGWLRRCGLVVVSTRHASCRYVDFPPRSAFESVLLRSLPDLHHVSFIQIGANDGQRADPIARFIDPCQWSGVMLEPAPGHFAALRARHGGNPRLALMQAALDATAGHRTLYDLRCDRADLPDWARGLGSLDQARVAEAARELGLDESAIVTAEVNTVTWDEVWRTFGDRRCDLLVLDTEGLDLALLRLAQLAQRRPHIILFEHACVPVDERFAFYRELVSLGYELATDGGDTTAVLASRSP